MKFRSTFVFAVLVAGVAVFSYLDFQKEKKQEAVEEKKDLVFGALEPADVQTIELERPGEKKMILKSEDQQWMLQAPVSDRADSPSVNAYVASLLEQSVRTADLNEAEVEWSEYGLVAPRAKLSLTTIDGKVRSLWISSREAFDGSFFLRRDKENKLLVGDGQWKQLAARKVKDLRDKKIFPKDKEVVEFVLQNRKTNKAPLKMKKEKGQWQVMGHPQLRVDQVKTNDFVTGIKNMRVLDFVSEESGPQQKKRNKLLNPEQVLKFYFAGSKDAREVWQLDVSRPVDSVVFVTSSARPTIYKVSKGYTDKWNKAQEDFRDKSYPFKFDKGRAHRLILTGWSRDIRLVQQDGHWVLANKDSSKVVDDAKVKMLLTKLSALEADRFVGKNEASFEGRGNNLVVKDKDGKSLIDLAWGKKFSDKAAKGAKKDFYLARTNLAEEVVGLEATKIEGLRLSSLVKDKPAETSTSKESSKATESKEVK